jgi:hypothetical protein
VAIDSLPFLVPMNDTTIISGEDIDLFVYSSVGNMFWLQADHATPVLDTEIRNITNTVQFVAQAINGVCPEPFTSVVTITVTGLPCVIRVSRDTTICPGEPFRLLPNFVSSYVAVTGWQVVGTNVELPPASVIRPESTLRLIAFGETRDGTNLTCESIDTLTITVQEIDLIVMDEKAVCGGQSVMLTSIPWNNVRWHDIYGNFLGEGNIEVIPQQNALSLYVATLTDGRCIRRDTARVFANPPDLRVFADAVTICVGESIHLTTNIEPHFIIWEDLSTGEFLDEDPTVSPRESGAFRAWAYDEICGDVFMDVEVTVHQIPEFNVMDNHLVCAPDQFFLTSAPNASFWKTIDGERVQNLTIQATEPGVKTFVAVFYDEGEICMVMDTLTVTIDVTEFIIRDDTTIFVNETVELWAIPDTVHWFDNTENLLGQGNQIITPNE